MTKYLLFTCGGLGYLILTLLTLRVNTGFNIPLSQYFNLVSPLLLAISAGLFFWRKTNTASILAIIGLGIASKDILQTWLIFDKVLQSKYVFKLSIFLALTTSFLFLLYFISIKLLMRPENHDQFEIMKYTPYRRIDTLIGIIPTIVTIITILTWFIMTMN